MQNFNPSQLVDGPMRPNGKPSPRKFGAAGGGYDATLPKGKRKPPAARARSEDAELNNSERTILQGTTRDLRRNFSVAAWAIRKHLDYVSSFTFQSRNQIPELDRKIKDLVKTWSQAENFDAGRRHSLPKMVRLAEALRTVDGDALVIQRQDGKVQLVEGDRIRNPIGAPTAAAGLKPEDIINIINGVLIDPSTGAARGYCVWRRDRTGMNLQFDRLVPAAFAALHGYYDRYDQVRGISPIAAAVNQYRDLYESFDYTLAKEKVAQLFALAFYRDNSDQLGIIDQEEELDGDGNEQEGYSIDFGRGPMVLDLDPGDRAEFLQSNNPSNESQAFWQFIIMIALKSLDIPYSFFDESHTNYSGLRVAWLMYDQSATVKRDDNRELLNRLTSWRLKLAILDGELELPAGVTLDSLKWEWVSAGIPWVDQTKEVAADIAAIGAGLDDPQEILKSRNKDPFEVIDRIAEFQDYAKSKGVQLSYTVPTINKEIQAEEEQDTSGNAGPNSGGKQKKTPPAPPAKKSADGPAK